MNNLFQNEPLGYGKIIKKISKNAFQVQIYEGLESGNQINKNIFNGTFYFKRDGIKNEMYEIDRNYLFQKDKCIAKGFIVSRNRISIIE